MRRFGLALALVALWPASTASSQTSTALSLATHRAEQFWNTTPCAGHFTVAIDLTDGNQGETYGCDAHLSRALFGTAAKQATDWPAFCRALAHEMGHAVLGTTYFAKWNPVDPSHSANPASVMFASDPAYPTSCFPATLTVGETTYRYVTRRRGLILSTEARNGHTTGRGLIAHPLQRPWHSK